MQRLIDAHEVYKYLHSLGGCDAEPGSWSDGWDKAIDTAICGLDDIPTIDPVHAAGGCYCEECEYRTKDTQWTRAGFCGRRDAGPMMIARPDDFCSRGKRNTECELD